MPRRCAKAGLVLVVVWTASALMGAGVAQAASGDPLFALTPTPPPPPAKPLPPPTGYLNGPCGLAVDSNGRFFLSDYYHRAIDVFLSTPEYAEQPLAGTGTNDHQGTLDDPCGLAVDSAGTLYVNNYHRDVVRFPTPLSPSTGTVIDSAHSTGVAVDKVGGEVYVDDRTYVAVYDSSGNPVEVGGEPLRIGEGTLGDGYGVAVSEYAPTEGFLYVPDASDDTVKVYDPATDTTNPVATLSGPPAGFDSLRDSAAAVDEVTGAVYVLDDTQPAEAEQPQAVVDVFDAGGTYSGHLKYQVVDGLPSGLAVDNTSRFTQGRVYVSSGNTHAAGVYGYAPGEAVLSAALPSSIPGPPLAAGQLNPTIPIGGPTASGSGSGVACAGDACQVLPPEPTDPTLTTLLSGHGNPKVRYRSSLRSCAALAHAARKLGLRSRRLSRRARHRPPVAAKRLRSRAAKLRRRARRVRRVAARRCRGSSASSSSLSGSPSHVEAGGTAAAAQSGGSATRAGATPSGLLAGGAGFGAQVGAATGGPATLAGSHPYRARFAVGLDQSSGEADMRNLSVELPAGLLADPAAANLCSASQFAAHRSSPFESSLSGESCPDRSQVGTVEVTTGLGGGQTRRFGLFELTPGDGVALELAAAPYGAPLHFDGRVVDDAGGVHLTLSATAVPASLRIEGLEVTLWGTPWDASHNTERGNCLNELDPAFAWAKCSPGEPLAYPPRAFLTLPTECSPTLSFTGRVVSWQGAGAIEREAVNPGAEGTAAPIEGCAALAFEPRTEGLLSTRKASSASGFVFRIVRDEDPGLVDPRSRIRAQAKGAMVQLPRGVTLNPSLGAGLDVCTPAQLAAESATGPPGVGCPNASQIGVFSVRLPFYKGLLEGSIFLAAPHDNPSGSLLAVYLVAKAADRGILVEVPGKLVLDQTDGTVTGVFDDLPQLPYTDLEVNFRTGQRAPLVTPDSCGAATTTTTMSPWAQGAADSVESTDSPIESGIGGGPCPSGTPPFAPEAIAGGVNSNVNSYTPYFVHLKRNDTEQEITSYSLVLPKGITGKLAGIPFCPDSSIDAARGNGGFAEAANPSCPGASQVGRTLTGYGVGSALTYAEGRIYLAGPYHGAPLSLVTINPATVGPFDLGTIVVRSAFQVDPLTAQLRIDSRASDPIPHIIDGIPLHLRDIRVYMDRHEFTHNPSSCEPSQLESTLTGSAPPFSDPHESTATVSEHFQLLNCLTLGFKPKLGLRLRGNPRRGGFPALRATFAARGPKDSNLKRIEVDMPHQLFLAQNHIRTVCTRVQFAADRCPAGSVYGRAVAYTPLLDQPLTGNVYLRSSSHKLPDLVTSLHAGAIRIELRGRIGPSKKGGIQAFFDNLPDEPINRFVMLLRGGKRGLLTNSVNICKRPPSASVKGLAQNNIGAIFTTKLRGQCHHKGKKKRHRRHHHKRKASR